MLLLVVCSVGCVRREGRNSDCRWPGETGMKEIDKRASGRHLSEDAELAEDLAIRYADAHYGLRSGHFESNDVFTNAIKHCGQTLFEDIGRAHGVPVNRVSQALGRNRVGTDLMVNLPFVLLYGLAASLVIRRIWARYPLADGWSSGAAMVLVCSLAFGVVGVLLGEEWSTTAESLRIGTGHLSYRVNRLPWMRYRGELFITLLAVFWFTGWFLGWRVAPPDGKPEHSSHRT
jgi:hypothetical protein